MTSEQNIGEWLNARYPDRRSFLRVIEKVVLERTSDELMPAVVSVAPTSTINEMFVGLHQLDYSKEAKHGCP